MKRTSANRLYALALLSTTVLMSNVVSSNMPVVREIAKTAANAADTITQEVIPEALAQSGLPSPYCGPSQASNVYYPTVSCIETLPPEPEPCSIPEECSLLRVSCNVTWVGPLYNQTYVDGSTQVWARAGCSWSALDTGGSKKAFVPYTLDSAIKLNTYCHDLMYQDLPQVFEGCPIVDIFIPQYCDYQLSIGTGDYLGFYSPHNNYDPQAAFTYDP
jgi:hypothetical protein